MSRGCGGRPAPIRDEMSPLPKTARTFSVNRERTEGGCHLFTAMESRMSKASRTLNSVSMRGLPLSESAR